MTFRPIWTVALTFLLFSVPAFSQTLEYTGYTEYDGRPATLSLTFSGLYVSGKLHVNPVCEQNSHLTGVGLDLSGTATGPWEDRSTTITGDWTGGDTDPCSGSTIKDDPSYPNEGSFTISMDGSGSESRIRLVRMPTGYGYVFNAKGSVITGGEGSGKPDLKLTEISVPTGIGPGMRAEIVATFKNEGSGDAGPFHLYGYAFPSQDYQKSAESEPVAVQGLGAGQTARASIPISVSSGAPAGTFDIKVAIDNSNYAGPGDVLETNENNNEMWKRKVSGAEAGTPAGGMEGLVDLVVTEVRFDPSQPQSPDKLTFIMGIKNLGGEKAKGFNAGFYLSHDRDITADDIYIGYGVIDLEPGESKSGPIPCNLPETLVPGHYYIGVIADPLEKLAESDETNNAMATGEPVFVPTSFRRISGQPLGSNIPGSQSETVYLQPGQTYTYQMPPAAFADGKSFAEQGIVSLTQSDYRNFVKWGPTDVLSGDGEETLGTGNSITLTAKKEGSATVSMTVFWEAKWQDGRVTQGYQDFTWNVMVGRDYSDGSLDKVKPSSSNTPVKKGSIVSGKIRGRVVYRPTGEPVAGATVHSIDFDDELKGGYPVGSPGKMLKTASDGSFEIDIAKSMPYGLEPGRFWIRIIKPYEGYLTSKVWDTTCLDLWVVQSLRKTFSLDKDFLEAGTKDVGVIEMDQAFRAVPGMECPVDPETGGPIEDAGWP